MADTQVVVMGGLGGRACQVIRSSTPLLLKPYGPGHLGFDYS
jgi:hypothetical protein